MPISRPIQLHDISDDSKLYQYLVEREKDWNRLQSVVDNIGGRVGSLNLDKPTAVRIKQALSSGGAGQLSVDALPGQLLQPQNPNIPTVSSLPDPNNSLYTMVALANAQSNSLYRLQTSIIPKSWQKVGDLTGLVNTGPGVVQQKSLGASLVVSPLASSALSDINPWSTPVFNAGNFTGSGSMTWIVISANVVTLESFVIGTLVILSFEIINTAVGGVADTTLQIKLPTTPSQSAAFGFMEYSDNGGSMKTSRCFTEVGGTVLKCTKIDSANWTASAGSTLVRGQIVYHI